MKDLRTIWENELEAKLPSLRQEVVNEPIPQRTASEAKRKKPVFKCISIISSIAAVLVICICAIPVLILQDKSDPVSPPLLSGSTATSSTTQIGSTMPSSGTIPSAPSNDTTGNPKDSMATKGSVLTVEINPRVMLVSDEKGIVTSVIATNADADVVLSCQGFDESVIGKSTADALVAYVDFATKLGYIDINGSENKVKITAAQGEAEESALTIAKESVEGYFESRGVSAVVIGNTATVGEICELNGLSQTDKIEDIIDSFKGKPTKYSDRRFDELEGKQLENYYKEIVISSVKGEVLETIQELQAVWEIAEINCQIIIMCRADYWTVKDYAVVDPALNELVLAMEEKLLLFQKNYGKEITDISQLSAITSRVTKEQLGELLENIEAFEDVAKYKELLDMLEKDSSKLNRLESIPASKEEMKKEHEKALQTESNNRIEQNKEHYKTESEEKGGGKPGCFDDADNQPGEGNEGSLPNANDKPEAMPEPACPNEKDGIDPPKNGK